MNYTVVWKQDAEDELADLWMHSADRKSLAAAANRLEKQLADDPLSLGDLAPARQELCSMGRWDLFLTSRRLIDSSPYCKF